LEFLRITQGDSFACRAGRHFTCNTGWKFYLQHILAVSRVTQVEFLRVNLGGSFTFTQVGSFRSNKEWLSYVWNRVPLLRIKE